MPRIILTRIIHGFIYYDAKLPAILARPPHLVLTVSGDTAARLPASHEAGREPKPGNHFGLS